MLNIFAILYTFSVCASISYAGVRVSPSAGYARGTFAPEESFTISGLHFGLEGGYQFPVRAYKISTGLLSRYSDLGYKTNGLKKGARWYYMGGYGSVALPMGDSGEIRLKGVYAPYSKLFVYSSTSLTINGHTEKIQESSLYTGGSGLEFTISLAKRKASKKKFAPGLFWGGELGAVRQNFNTKKQKNTVSHTGESDVETSNLESGTYRLNMFMASLTGGIEF